MANDCATLVKLPSAAGDSAAGDRERTPVIKLTTSHNHDVAVGIRVPATSKVSLVFIEIDRCAAVR